MKLLIKNKKNYVQSKYLNMIKPYNYLNNSKYNSGAIYYLGDIGDYNYNLQSLIKIIEQEINIDDIIIILGDNFYPSGVTCLNDKLWKKFDNTFRNISNPIYSLLGNHDYKQNPHAQIQYKSNNWNMPNWYYSITKNNIDFIFLDTITLAPNESPNFNSKFIEKIHKKSIKQLQKEQINWLENKLKQNNNIKIVHGHYPIFTMGVYQRCKELSKILIPIFKKYNVQYYISGHEHNIQFLSYEMDKDKDKDLNMFICGSSSYARVIPGSNYNFKDSYIKSIVSLIRLQQINNKLDFNYINSNNKVVLNKEFIIN
jgi:tartrate-resistant acid phosphatase type 5